VLGRRSEQIAGLVADSNGVLARCWTNEIRSTRC